jgi:hypothetical protein
MVFDVYIEYSPVPKTEEPRLVKDSSQLLESELPLYSEYPEILWHLEPDKSK